MSALQPATLSGPRLATGLTLLALVGLLGGCGGDGDRNQKDISGENPAANTPVTIIPTPATLASSPPIRASGATGSLSVARDEGPGSELLNPFVSSQITSFEFFPGVFVVDYTLIDADSDPSDITVEWSTNSGTTFFPALEFTSGVTLPLSSVDEEGTPIPSATPFVVTSEGTTGLATSPAGVRHRFVWASFQETFIDDFGSLSRGILLRVTATDAAIIGGVVPDDLSNVLEIRITGFANPFFAPQIRNGSMVAGTTDNAVSMSFLTNLNGILEDLTALLDEDIFLGVNDLVVFVQFDSTILTPSAPAAAYGGIGTILGKLGGTVEATQVAANVMRYHAYAPRAFVTGTAPDTNFDGRADGRTALGFAPNSLPLFSMLFDSAAAANTTTTLEVLDGFGGESTRAAITSLASTGSVTGFPLEAEDPQLPIPALAVEVPTTLQFGDLITSSVYDGDVLVFPGIPYSPVVPVPGNTFNDGFVGLVGTFGFPELDDPYENGYFSVPLASIPAGTRSVVITATDPFLGAGDLDLAVGRPGTAPGDIVTASYAYFGLLSGTNECVAINDFTDPSLADYLASGTDIAVALAAFSPSDYRLSVLCTDAIVFSTRCDQLFVGQVPTGTGTGTFDLANRDANVWLCLPLQASTTEVSADLESFGRADLALGVGVPGVLPGDPFVANYFFAGVLGTSNEEIMVDDNGITTNGSLNSFPGILTFGYLDLAGLRLMTLVVADTGIGGPFTVRLECQR